MFNRWSFAIAWIGLVAVLAGTCGGGASKPKTPQCQLPSDCKDPLICIQTYCVKACNEGRDCPAGARCIKATEGNSCQPFEKVTCSLRSDCTQPLVCGIDLQCRNQCKEDIDCTGGQKCTSVSHLCADPERDKNYDPVTNEFKPVDGGAGGGAGGKDGGGTDGEDGGGNGGADGATACKGPQTLFGNIIQGDPNPNFTSGVGVRSGNQVFIFSGYRTAPDAGAADPDAGTPAGNAVYVQAFNATTGASAGAPVALFPVADSGPWGVSDVSVAPTGEIALLYSRALPGSGQALHAAFLSAGTPDAGAAGLQVSQNVLIESAPFQYPHVTWAANSKRFVLSWKYQTTAWFVRVKKFLPDGRGAGGDTNAVEAPTLDSRWDQGSVGTSADLFGAVTVASATYFPFLTILDSVGNPVRDSIAAPNVYLNNGSNWVSVGGVANGFVVLAHNSGTVHAAFVPTTGAGSVLADGGAPADAGNGDAGDAGKPSYDTFTFPSTASTAHMISDDTGGAGGVGAVLLEQNGASFLYVMPDGTTRMATGTVISSANGAGAAISNYRGSFAISLYDSTAHATQMVATSCPP